MAVDARLGGVSVRFVNTHLEVAGPPAAAAVQLAQARELVDGPARTTSARRHGRRLQLAPRPPDVRRAARGRLRRRLDARQPGRTCAGFTCCHAQPLDDPEDALRGRIDLVLTRGEIAATEAFVVGDDPGDFRAGLWPSDHAGVVATLEPV